ncbi:protein 5NUC-like isoform X1 [Dermacentor silvarum]|uniref:protein 5NUC-like isoform X1 n=1 Tax=Dermacentor silvarum TaxID=543639 RepID=UPI00189B6757|nr:protein 5NUC-like isoform X1 [Dermacentor silvarum]
MVHHQKYAANAIFLAIFMSTSSQWHRCTASKGDFNLTILHTNDVHAHLEESNKYGGKCFDEKNENSTCVGGVARIVSKVKEIREKNPNALFVNAGDFFQGTPYYTLFKQEVISEVMSVMGYNFACLGNHEFDDGPKNLAPFLKKMNESNVTIVGTNTDFSKDSDLSPYDLPKHAITTINRKKIGILGAVIPSTKYGSSPGPHVEFYEEIESFKNETAKLLEEKVDIIIAITHSGFKREIDIVQNVPAIDILVGGHTNTFLYTGDDRPKENKPVDVYPYVVNRSDGSQALVVQDYCFGKFLGRLDVTFNGTGHIVHWGGNPILLDRNVKEDQCITDVLKPFKENLTAQMGVVIGSTQVLMEHNHDICRMQECNLGNLIADAYYEYYLNMTTTTGPVWSDLNGAVVNAGSIRTALPSFYNVTWGDVVTTLPYGNSLLTMTLSGTDVWKMFEHAATNYTTEEDKQKGRFLQVSGFRVQYDLTKNNYDRVVSISVLCANCSVPIYQPLDCNKSYKIVAADFVARGGDGFKFANSVIVSDVGPIEYEALENYIVKMSPMRTPNEGRIMITLNSTDERAVQNYTKLIREDQTCKDGTCNPNQ